MIYVKYTSYYDGVLVAKYYYDKHKLAWELLDDGLKELGVAMTTMKLGNEFDFGAISRTATWLEPPKIEFLNICLSKC